MRDTEHFFFKLSAFQEPLLEWLRTREGWRKHVQNYSIGWVEEGLHDRAITRDLEWGVPHPGRGPRARQAHLRLVRGVHRLRVGVEGVGAAAAATRRRGGRGGRTRRAETYYFIGKDNIFFHTIFWPAVLMAYGGLNLPTDVPGEPVRHVQGREGVEERGRRRVGAVVPRALPARRDPLRASPRTCPRRRTRTSPRRS